MTALSFRMQLLLCAAGPIVGCLLVGAFANVPGNVLLWQCCVGAFIGAALCWQVLQHHRRLLHEHVENLRLLERALTEEELRPPTRFSNSPDEFLQIEQQWNKTAQRVYATVEWLRRREQGLVNDRKLLQTVLESMSEGLVAIDQSQAILYVNPAARRMLELPGRDLVNKALWEVVRDKSLLAHVDDLLSSELPSVVRIELSRQRNVVEVSSFGVSLGPGTGFVLMLRDVTELKRLERSRRDFFSSVSHELKTPLTAIQCYAETLLDGGMDDAQNSGIFLDRIVEQSGKMLELVQDILRLARIESQMETLVLVPLRLDEFVLECVSERVAIAQSREIDIVVETEVTELTVRGEPVGLRSIIQNLLTNAINYNQSGGTVRVRWRAAGNDAVLEIEDTGVGIAEEHRDRIFERFYRVDKARSRNDAGTGLGLAIVKHLVSQFGGRIELESQLGRGSLFRVLFPLNEAPELTVVPGQSTLLAPFSPSEQEN
ncbi:MAG: PAS domain S-box protein [Planctomycetaceae bacterium]|nr:PAS domain S-box protein [Planctomycetaceae bacterium]